MPLMCYKPCPPLNLPKRHVNSSFQLPCLCWCKQTLVCPQYLLHSRRYPLWRGHWLSSVGGEGRGGEGEGKRGGRGRGSWKKSISCNASIHNTFDCVSMNFTPFHDMERVMAGSFCMFSVVVYKNRTNCLVKDSLWACGPVAWVTSSNRQD